MAQADTARRNRLWPGIGVAILLLHLIILLPGYPPSLGIAAFLRLPLELPLVILLLALSRGLLQRWLRYSVVIMAALLVLLRLANLGSQLAFGRSFNPLLEMHLVFDGWNLASGSIGRMPALLLAAMAVLVLYLLCRLLHRGLSAISRLPDRGRRGLITASAIVLLTGLAALGIDRISGQSLPVQARLSTEITGRIDSMQRSMADLQVFNDALPDDPLSGDAQPGFAALAGRDVLVIFIESYGRSFVDDPLYRDRASLALTAFEERVEQAGLGVSSGWVRSSVRGGRSWLTHATLMSGLRVTNQARFDRLTISARTSLARLFGAAGWRTAGLMPAIQLDWPEGGWYGFDDFRDAHTLGYQGQPFGWVTMPDQYVLSAFEQQIRRDDAPVMATLALTSSHAPWTPLPRPVDWEDVRDGALYDGRFRYGGTAGELWSDPDQVREHYALSIEYSLQIVGEYLARHGDDGLILVLGDHPPAPVIERENTSFDVPLHVISADRDLLARWPEGMMVDGMMPAPTLPSQPLESLRELLSRRFE